MNIRDRIKELRRVKAGELRPHPKNWRTHPESQQDALRGVLAEIGYADALIARELPDGSLQLIDGHLRAQITPEMEVPVLVVDLDDDETAKLLVLLDPLASLAETDAALLSELVAQVETENEAVGAVLERMLAELEPSLAGEPPFPEPREVEIPEAFQVVVECADEDQQQTVFERMTGEGFQCRLLTL
ncbi:MAG: ParB N-terminal domain-containing protein [Planctomycetes bacterium]|nr:ParB N-terminal domain-containing protein [Planctomycetota bacterium]